MDTYRGTRVDGRGEPPTASRELDSGAAHDRAGPNGSVGSGATSVRGVAVGGGDQVGPPISVAVRTILCTWELVTAIYPRGSEERHTKTYLHRHPTRALFSILRMQRGALVSHTFLTDVELTALGGVAV